MTAQSFIFTTTSVGQTGPLAAALSRVAYRPGWSFRVDGDSWLTATYGTSGPITTPVLHIIAVVPDSNDSSRMTSLDHTFSVPFSLLHDEAGFLAWFAEMLVAVERHESREFLRVDGRRYIDPHRDSNTRLYE